MQTSETPPDPARISRRAELNPEMEKLELHAFGLRAMLDTAQAELGTTVVEDMLLSLGMSLERLTGKDAWASMAFVEGFMSEMVLRSGDAAIIDRFSEASISPKYLGVIYPLMRAFGNPGLVYDGVVRTIPRVNKVGLYTILERKPGFVRLDYRPVAGAARDRTPWFCRSRLVQLACVPTWFGLSTAKSKHPRCMARGDESCVYELTWQVPKRQGFAWAGLGVGAAVGLAVGAVGAGTALAIFAVLASGLAGWALARGVQLGESHDLRTAELRDHHEALKQSVRQNEERFSELLVAKAHVESRVEERTRELREATDQLAASLQKIQELDRAKTDFFNNVSHEFRSPLTLILAPLEDLVAGRAPPGGAAAAFDAMHRNASRLLRLINQLLDLAKIDAGEMKLAPSATDLAALTRTACLGFEAGAKKKGVLLELQLPASMDPVVVDATWIDSAVTNLIANALRHTQAGGCVKVCVEEQPDDLIVISVADNGPGIAAADQTRIFERFAQGDSSKRVLGGTGIGLALVRETARMHGGTAEVTSEPGKGATFRLTIPRNTNLVPTAGQPSAALVRAPVPEGFANDSSTEEREGPGPNAPLAIVVEDNPDIRVFVANVLASKFRVRTAEDGHAALALVQTLKPDIVISDVAMPEMDGFELCRQLRANEVTRAIPVLLVTARTNMESVLEGFEAGASDYVLKPFHPTELLARVEVHVRVRVLMARLVHNERLATLGSLAGSVAHQVRNPLNALIAGLPAMRGRLGSRLDPATSELMGVMIDCAERIERVTVDLLDLSRIDREESGEFAPGLGLAAAARTVGSRLGSNGTLNLDIDEVTMTSGRAAEMNQVFMNLLDNAVRAVGDNGTIDVRGKRIGNTYVVTVADSGPGIPKDQADRIFEPFWTTRAAGEGSGLGLSIAKQIAERHGGAITVGVSQLGGALFTFSLPIDGFAGANG